MGASATFKGDPLGAPNMAYEALDFFDVDALLSEEELMVRDMVRDWVDEKVIPNIEQHYLDGTFPREWIQDLGDMGILGMVVPEAVSYTHLTLPTNREV